MNTERIGSTPAICVDHAGQGELLLLLHGIGGNRHNWQDQWAAFTPHFHTVAWDARGYGDSDDYEGPLAFADFTHDVLRVLDYFAAPKVHLAGLSMGGRIAMEVAVHYPERLHTLTLIDTHPGFAHLSEADKAAFVRSRTQPLLEGQHPRQMAELVAPTLVGSQASAQVVHRLVDSMAALHITSYIKAIHATIQTQCLETLHTVQVPTHVIVGAEDRLTPPTVAREIAATIPGAELTIIEQAGHLVNIEQPEAFNHAVLNFLLRYRGG